jgi:sugar/nucleoside kinase (ribokinase family)
MSSADGGGAAGAPRVLCAGITVEDHVYQLARFPAPGTKTRAREFALVGGGCAANGAVALARLGGRARLATPLGGPPGTDAIGDRILARLMRDGVDCSAAVRVSGATSPISAILLDASGERMIVNHRDEALSTARVADPDALVADCDALLVDNRFVDFVLPLCHAGRRRGLPVVLDGDRPTRATDEFLNACSHIVFAAEGLRATANCDDLVAALKSTAARTSSFLAVTDGQNGVHWLHGGAPRRLPAHAVPVVDTLGAGDVFHGAFTLALAEGRDEVAALTFATAAAAVKCTRFGGIAGAPSRGEVAAFLMERRVSLV